MELIEYNPINCISSSAQTRTPVIGISLKSGKLSFNTAASDKLGIKHNSMVKFFQEKNDPECWYLEIVKENGFQVKQRKSGKNFPTIINNKKLVIELFESVKHKGESGRIILAGQPTKLEDRTLWGLIVTTIKNQ